jgi:hypothetical protein
VPPAPHIIAEFDDGQVYAQEIFVIGTNNEKLHLHALIYE